VRGTEYYLRALDIRSGVARFTRAFLTRAEDAVRDGLGNI
jgi:hypothetical protein